MSQITTAELLLDLLRRRRYEAIEPTTVSALAAQAVADGDYDDVVLELASLLTPSSDVDSIMLEALLELGMADADSAVRDLQVRRLCEEINTGALEPIAGGSKLATLFYEDEAAREGTSVESPLIGFWRATSQLDVPEDRDEVAADVVRLANDYLATAKPGATGD